MKLQVYIAIGTEIHLWSKRLASIINKDLFEYQFCILKYEYYVHARFLHPPAIPLVHIAFDNFCRPKDHKNGYI